MPNVIIMYQNSVLLSRVHIGKYEDILETYEQETNIVLM